MSFHRCSYKNSCFSELAYNSSVLVLILWSAASNSKDMVLLKNVALDFVLLVLKLYPIQVVISLPLWIKLTMGQLLLFFLWNFSSFFSLRRRCPRNQTFFTVCYWLIGIFGYSVNNNKRGAFAIHFVICSNLLNCLRSLGTMVITTKSG